MKIFEKKLIAIILTIAMMFSLSVPAYSAENPDTGIKIGDYTLLNSDLKSGNGIEEDPYLFPGEGEKEADVTAVISAGWLCSLLVKSDGSLWAWGDNWAGQLGDGTTEDKSTPVMIMEGVESVSAGDYRSLAVKSDGSLWAWGFNKCGQVGDGTTESKSTPVEIMKEVESASAGDDHGLAVKSDGSLWSWGYNESGQLGDDTTESKSTPVEIMKEVESASAGWAHSLAVKSDGSLWAWGDNGYGQLGDGTTENKSTPVEIMKEVESVSAGLYHSLAVKSDGSLWAWGDNKSGQLGDVMTESKSTPAKIMEGVKSVSAGSYHSLVVKSDGSLWAWGDNSRGQLGDGTTGSKSTPVKIMEGVESVSAGGYHSLAIKSDGSLWAWGYNTYGQLGDGTTEDKNIPIEIMETVRPDVPVEFAGGSGTEADPYRISTPEQLDAVRNDLSAYYVLDNDIDLSAWENWEPIGFDSFRGSFDGNNYKIANMTIKEDEGTAYVGLFGCLGGGAVIKNVELENTSITFSSASSEVSYVGGIAGHAFLDANSSVIIENCRNSGDVSLSSYGYAGGIVGSVSAASNSSITIENCTNSGFVYSYANVGGIIGDALAGDYSSLTIGNCTNSGSVYSDGDSGGILGHAYAASNSSITIDNCTNRGNVSSLGTAGGIVGHAYADANSSVIIGNSTNRGDVSPGDSYEGATGGIVGSAYSESNSSIVIENNTNSGNVYTYYGYVGGIVGYVVAIDVDSSITIENSTNKGNVSLSGYTGGIIGELAGNGTLIIKPYCYYHCYYPDPIPAIGNQWGPTSIIGLENAIAVEINQTDQEAPVVSIAITPAEAPFVDIEAQAKDDQELYRIHIEVKVDEGVWEEAYSQFFINSAKGTVGFRYDISAVTNKLEARAYALDKGLNRSAYASALYEVGAEPEIISFAINQANPEAAFTWSLEAQSQHPLDKILLEYSTNMNEWQIIEEIDIGIDNEVSQQINLTGTCANNNLPLTNYYVRATVVDREGNASTPSQPCAVYADLTPVVLDITPANSSWLAGEAEIEITAQDNVGLSEIELQTSLDNGANWQTYTVVETPNATTYTATVPFNADQYGDNKTIRLRAIATNGVGYTSNGYPIRLYYLYAGSTPPLPIENLRYESTTTKITLHWNDVSEEDFSYFRLEQLQNGGFELIASIYDKLGYTIENLPPASAYTYRVAAVNRAGQIGEYSETITASTLADTFAPVITALNPKSARYSSAIPLTVTAKDDYQVAKIAIETARDGQNWTSAAVIDSFTPASSVTAKYTLDISTLDEGSLYVRAIAEDAAGNHSDTSETAPFVEYLIDRTPPAVPTGLQLNEQTGYINVQWNQNTENDLAGYDVYRSAEGEEGTFTKIASSLKTVNYIDRDVTKSTTYYYKISVTDTAGNISGFSAVVSGSPLQDQTAPEIISISPATGSTLGPNAKIGILASDNNKLSKIEAWYRIKDGSWTSLGAYTANTSSALWTITLNTAEIGENPIEIKAQATDVSGNQSAEVTAEYTLNLTLPQAPTLTVTPQAMALEAAWICQNETDLAGFKLYRKAETESSYSLRVQIPFVAGQTAYAYVDKNVDITKRYSYRVEAIDQYANSSYSENSGYYYPLNTDEEAPVAVIDSPGVTETGKATKFNGGQSSDNVGIYAYKWDFGDETTSALASPSHIYSQKGMYTVTLNVTDFAGHSTTTEAQITVYDGAELGKAQIKILDESGTPISGVKIYLDLGSEEMTTVTTDLNGLAEIKRLPGSYVIGAYKEHYLPIKKEIAFAAGVTQEYRYNMVNSEIIVGELTYHRMSLDEIVAAGIDVYAPENQHVFKFEIELTYGNQTVSVPVICNSEGQVYNGGSFIFYDYGSGNGSGATRIVTPYVYPTSDPSKPLIALIDLPGEATWLKEFFDVNLRLLNQADPEFSLINCAATLNVQEGMTLMTGTTASGTPKVDIGTIWGQETKDLHWILRGDKEGEYNLSADFSGILADFNEEINARFATKEPLKVYGSEGLKLEIAIADKVYNGVFYFDVALYNEDRDDAVYLPSLNISDATYTFSDLLKPDGSIERLTTVDPVGLNRGEALVRHYFVVIPEAADAKQLELEIRSKVLKSISGLTIPSEFVVEGLEHFNSYKRYLGDALEIVRSYQNENIHLPYMTDGDRFVYWTTIADLDGGLGLQGTTLKLGQLVVDFDGVIHDTLTFDREKEVLASFIESTHQDMMERAGYDTLKDTFEVFASGLEEFLDESSIYDTNIKKAIKEKIKVFREIHLDDLSRMTEYSSLEVVEEAFGGFCIDNDYDGLVEAFSDYSKSSKKLAGYRNKLIVLGISADLVDVILNTIVDTKDANKVLDRVLRVLETDEYYGEFLQTVYDNTSNPYLKVAAAQLRNAKEEDKNNWMEELYVHITVNGLEETMNFIDRLYVEAPWWVTAITKGSDYLFNITESTECVDNMRILTHIDMALEKSLCGQLGQSNAEGRLTEAFEAARGTDFYDSLTDEGARKMLCDMYYLIRARELGERSVYNYYEALQKNVINAIRDWGGEDHKTMREWYESTYAFLQRSRARLLGGASAFMLPRNPALPSAPTVTIDYSNARTVESFDQSYEYSYDGRVWQTCDDASIEILSSVKPSSLYVRKKASQTVSAGNAALLEVGAKPMLSRAIEVFSNNETIRLENLESNVTYSYVLSNDISQISWDECEQITTQTSSAMIQNPNGFRYLHLIRNGDEAQFDSLSGVFDLAVITHTITATAGPGGSITPSGAVSVTKESGQTFTITADSGYEISDVEVDGLSVGAVETYTFENVTADHTIAVTFAQPGATTHTITATAGPGGSITPSGAVTVSEGDDQTFAITADSGYEISDVEVDGLSVGAVETYIFENVTADHTIAVTFVSSGAITYIVTATAGDGGSVSGGGTFSANDTVILTATPNSNYTFDGWYEDNVRIDGAGATYTFTATEDRTLQARFTYPGSTGDSGGSSERGGSVGGGAAGQPATNQNEEETKSSGSAQEVDTKATEPIQLKTGDGVQVTIPPGALSKWTEPVELAITLGTITTPPQNNSNVVMLNPFAYQRQFDIEGVPEGETQFDEPLTITFPIKVDELPEGITTNQLAIYWWDPDKKDWIKLGGVYDEATQTLSVPVWHFSTYAVMADTNPAPSRLAGYDRFETANAIADQGWPSGGDNVILVNAYSFPDALAAGPLAYKLNAPILLTDAADLTPATQAQIRKLAPKKITLIGGTAVISQGIQDALNATYGEANVVRYSGIDRYATAAEIAKALGTTGQAVIANGQDGLYMDALAVSSYAAYNGIPILFTEAAGLPEATAQALADRKVKTTIVVGGAAVVPEEVFNQLPGATRYAGYDCYETATAIATGLKLNLSRVYVVSGLNFPDALVAGNLASRTLAPLVMVDRELPSATGSFLNTNRAAIKGLTIVGGEGIITASQEEAVRGVLE